MQIKNISVILLLCLFTGCNDGQKSKEETAEKTGVFAKGWNSVKAGVAVPFEYFDERSSKADSTKDAFIAQHFRVLREQYPEYSAAEKWFKSGPPELLGLEGNFYKITEGTIQSGRSISRSHFVEPTNGNVFLYFYQSEKRFFILELEINERVTCKSVRCIMEGWGKQPMFDYLYDEKGNLVEEVFQADVQPSFYEDNEQLFFEYANQNIINTILLGPAI